MKNKKTIIAVILSLFFVGFVLFFLFGQKQTEKPQEEIPTPTPETSVVIEQTGKGDPNALQRLEEETVKGYPLFPNTPHRETNWTLDYIATMRLEVTVKGVVTEAIKSEVFEWIKSQGIDPATHQIDWKTTR